MTNKTKSEQLGDPQPEKRESLKELIRKEPGIVSTLSEVDDAIDAKMQDTIPLFQKRQELRSKLAEIANAKAELQNL